MADETAALIWRDYITDGVPLSGRQKPVKQDIRDWGSLVEAHFNFNRVSLSASATIGSTYNRKTVVVTAAAVTLTMSASSGLADGHRMWVVNPKGDMAVRIQSATGEFPSFWLWPYQRAEFYKTTDGSSAVMGISRPNRYRPRGGETIYVDPAGSDSNDGLSASRPMRTVEAAIRVVEYQIDHDGVGTQIKCAAGVYTDSWTHTFRIVGYHVISIVGADTTDPSQTIFRRTSNGGTIATIRDYSAVIVRAVTFEATGTGSVGMSASQTGIADVWDCHFGTFASGYHLESTNGGSMGYVVGSSLNRVKGSAVYHWLVSARSSLICTGTTITVDGGLTFTYFLLVTGVSSAIFSSVTFSGAGAGAGTTGQKWAASNWGWITGMGSVTLPGATAGSPASGAGPDAYGGVVQ